MDYEPIKSFTRIGGCWRYNEVLAVKADSRWKTWNEFYEYVKKNPNEVKVGFSNPIGSVVGTMKLIARRNQLEWREVITTGEAELVSQLLGDHISAFVGAGGVHTLFKDGRADRYWPLPMTKCLIILRFRRPMNYTESIR